MTYERLPEYFSGAEGTIQLKKEIITKANRIIAISENTKKDIVEILNSLHWEDKSFYYPINIFFLLVIEPVIKIFNDYWKHLQTFIKT